MFCLLGRLPSIWDALTHDHSDLIVDHSTGDTAANSYDLYEKDVEILKDVGVSRCIATAIICKVKSFL
jgi:beta-glucosidase/6-phospho-beta-glucosidase/beta-galactosidase